LDYLELCESDSALGVIVLARTRSITGGKPVRIVQGYTENPLSRATENQRGASGPMSSIPER